MLIRLGTCSARGWVHEFKSLVKAKKEGRERESEFNSLVKANKEVRERERLERSVSRFQAKNKKIHGSSEALVG